MGEQRREARAAEGKTSLPCVCVFVRVCKHFRSTPGERQMQSMSLMSEEATCISIAMFYSAGYTHRAVVATHRSAMAVNGKCNRNELNI